MPHVFAAIESCNDEFIVESIRAEGQRKTRDHGMPKSPCEECYFTGRVWMANMAEWGGDNGPRWQGRGFWKEGEVLAGGEMTGLRSCHRKRSFPFASFSQNCAGLSITRSAFWWLICCLTGRFLSMLQGHKLSTLLRLMLHSSGPGKRFGVVLVGLSEMKIHKQLIFVISYNGKTCLFCPNTSLR